MRERLVEAMADVLPRGRGILFSAPMVRALLDGRKSQTRRLLKPQPPADWPFLGIYAPGLTAVFGDPLAVDDHTVRLPSIGDRLWVRESWATWMHAPDLHDFFGDPLSRDPDSWVYRADSEEDWQAMLHDRRLLRQSNSDKAKRDGNYAVRSPIHMPRWASRITLTVTDVRVQRLQEITSADAIAEGCPAHANSQTIDCDTPDPRDDYRALWESLHGAGAWDANPWVVALTFTVQMGNIDHA